MQLGSKFRLNPRELARFQFEHPLKIVGVAFLLGLLSLPFVAQLSLNGDFTALLPEHKSSVQDLEEIQRRFGRQATLTLAVEAETSTVARVIVSDLAEGLSQSGSELISAVDWNVRDFSAFAEKYRYLYADLEDLEEIRDVLSERLSYELSKVNPLYVDLAESDEPPPDPQKVVERLQAKAEEARSKIDRFPNGFFQHPTLPLVVLFIRTTIKGGETHQVDKLLRLVQDIQEQTAKRFSDNQFKVFRGGDLMDIREEQEALTRAVIWATIITVLLVLTAIYIFFMQLEAIVVLGLSIIPPLLMTFGFAEVTIDYLNASSAFLSSIVLGNGINPNVIWLARYFEARRGGSELCDGIAETHRATWAATLTASSAAGLAYVSLTMTDFRGFRDFGIIGGTGMALCWLSAYLVLPAMVILFERYVMNRVSAAKSRALGQAEGWSYGRIFSAIVIRSPGLTVFVSGVVTILSVGLVYLAIIANPLEYDFRNLQSRRPAESRTQWVNDRQSEIVDETTTGSAIAVLVDEPSEAVEVKNQLEKYRVQTSSTAFASVRTIWDLLPKDQTEKIEVLEEVQEIWPKLLKHAKGKDKEQLQKNRLPEDIEAIKPTDIPESIARYFTETDGSLGKIVFVEHHPARNHWDGEYLVEWATAARSVRLSEGERPAIAGQPPVFADLLDSIFVDGPKAVLVALIATMLILLVTFRRWSERFFTLSTLLLGILWMAALMALAGIKLNFLNFVAFPITFGNGVDYGVNVMRRYVDELRLAEGNRWVAVRAAVEGTGGAVVLCSLTTIIGYISLYTSSNSALNSFGAAMAISEVTCVFAGVLTLPALLMLAGQHLSKSSAPKS